MKGWSPLSTTSSPATPRFICPKKSLSSRPGRKRLWWRRSTPWSRACIKPGSSSACFCPFCRYRSSASWPAEATGWPLPSLPCFPLCLCLFYPSWILASGGNWLESGAGGWPGCPLSDNSCYFRIIKNYPLRCPKILLGCDVSKSCS